MRTIKRQWLNDHVENWKSIDKDVQYMYNEFQEIDDDQNYFIYEVDDWTSESIVFERKPDGKWHQSGKPFKVVNIGFLRNTPFPTGNLLLIDAYISRLVESSEWNDPILLIWGTRNEDLFNEQDSNEDDEDEEEPEDIFYRFYSDRNHPVEKIDQIPEGILNFVKEADSFNVIDSFKIVLTQEDIKV